MRRSANGAARYGVQTGLSSRNYTRKWHYISGKSRNSVSLPTQNQRLARNPPIGLSKLGQAMRLPQIKISPAKRALSREQTDQVNANERRRLAEQTATLLRI